MVLGDVTRAAARIVNRLGEAFAALTKQKVRYQLDVKPLVFLLQQLYSLPGMGRRCRGFKDVGVNHLYRVSGLQSIAAKTRQLS